MFHALCAVNACTALLNRRDEFHDSFHFFFFIRFLLLYLSDLEWSTFVSVSILMHVAFCWCCCCCCRWQRYGTSLNYCCTCSPNRSFINYIHSADAHIYALDSVQSLLHSFSIQIRCAYVYLCVALCISLTMRTNCST